ncbi:MAG: TOBE domain-containing protein, partial [Polaromonas sp.]|nr:TOBE domain-containing protein [Polaromonas sp.]
MNLLKNGPNIALGGPDGAILGIRPEHLKITDTGWPMRVETIEMLGAERLVYGRFGDEQLIVRTDENDACPTLDSTIHVTPRPERLHWFDAASTKRIP